MKKMKHTLMDLIVNPALIPECQKKGSSEKHILTDKSGFWIWAINFDNPFSDGEMDSLFVVYDGVIIGYTAPVFVRRGDLDGLQDCIWFIQKATPLSTHQKGT